MRSQTQTFDKGNRLFIQTPLGMIEITRLKNESLKKLRFKMPDFFEIHKNGGSVKNGLVKEKDGKLFPDFSLLVPVVSKDGELQGVAIPKVLRVRKKQDAPS